MTRDRNNLDIAAIDPRNGPKFSPKLHKWLTDRYRPYRAWNSRLYRGEQGTLYIGFIDGGDLIGTRLMDVLCAGRRAQTFCYLGMHDLVEVADFWSHYMRDGRCAIDPEHKIGFVGDEARWEVKGDTRTCLWCGACRQVLVCWTEEVKRSAWRTEALEVVA